MSLGHSTSNTRICKDFMHKKCNRTACRFMHNPDLCFHFWKFGSCKFGDSCQKTHVACSVTSASANLKPRSKTHKVRNTESFEPLSKPVDMRIVVDAGGPNDTLSTTLTSRDVLMAPLLFSDFQQGEIFSRLVSDITTCEVPASKLLKLWHGDTHLIADDHTNWKTFAPTFNMVLDRLRKFFNMNIKATRFNWYKDTSQWKPFHFDSAAVNPEKAKSQNFTVAVSFGNTRDAAFEHPASKLVISMPQSDGTIYAFCSDTNRLWRHGILKEDSVREEGRISIIAWGWIDM